MVEQFSNLPTWRRIYVVLFIAYGLYLLACGGYFILMGDSSFLRIWDLITGPVAVVSGLLLLTEYSIVKPLAICAMIGFLVSFAVDMIKDDGLTVANAAGTAVWVLAVCDLAATRFRKECHRKNRV